MAGHEFRCSSLQVTSRDGHKAEEVESDIGNVAKRREHRKDKGSAKALSISV
jgi:hypothetical protein